MKVLIVGDSPRLKTGFGRVNGIAAQAYLKDGWEVASLTALASEAPTTEDGIKTYLPTKEGDVWGFHDLPDVIDDFQPDLIYNSGDPGSIAMATTLIHEDNRFLGYIYIEGEPIGNQSWQMLLSSLEYFTCSKYAKDLVRRQLGRDVDYVYSGVDHEVFNTDSRSMREEVRKTFGWTDKFVVMCVAQNVRRKQIPRLLEAFSILKDKFKQHKDMVLYLHMVPFNNFWLDGWNLLDAVQTFDVADVTFFHPAMNKMNKSIPELTGNPQYPGLVELYNAADLFVLPSQVEGFGLPIAEAMACGLPVLVTKYAAGWEIASPAGKGIPPHDWEFHKSGTMYANVKPLDIANEIMRLKRSPKELERMSKLGLERVKDFQWSNFTDKLITESHRIVSSANPFSSAVSEEDDKGQEEGPEEVVIREDEAIYIKPESDSRAAWQGEDATSQTSQDEYVAKEENVRPTSTAKR